jgi:hypothetical protein
MRLLARASPARVVALGPHPKKDDVCGDRGHYGLDTVSAKARRAGKERRAFRGLPSGVARGSGRAITCA